MKKLAVVTGGNRGLGFEATLQLAKKGYTVILTARDSKKGEAAAEKLRKENLDVHFHILDVASSKSIRSFGAFMEKEYGRCDVLINNAGIFLDDVAAETVGTSFETNVLGPYQMIQVLAPLMKKNKYGRIVNVSSGMGQLSEMNAGYPAYRISKTALNAVTRIFSEEFSEHNVLVNSICPGWVKTDMGGPNAERTIPEGADTMVWAATLPDDGPTGSFFRDRKPIAW